MRNLLDTFVVLRPDLSAVPVAVTPTIYQELDQRFDAFKGHVLVSRFDFDRDWSTWEIHPHGDEIVVLLSGATDLVLDEGGTHRVLSLAKPGEYAVVPKGTWHTAKTVVPTMMLFVTPGEGTENRDV